MIALWPGCALRVRSGATVIPPITEPLGRYWAQPQRSDIVMDDDVAYMSQRTWALLADYSHSRPTSVYDGKMWRATDWDKSKWLLWYGISSQTNRWSVNCRKVELIGEDRNG